MFKTTLALEFEALKADLLAAYKESEQYTSGNWGNTVQVVELPNGFRLVADGYIKGRKPGKQPPSEAIELWLQQKGIAAQAEKNINISTLAYLIARKIGREGWRPKEPHFIDTVITAERIQDMLGAAANTTLEFFINHLTYLVKNIAV